MTSAPKVKVPIQEVRLLATPHALVLEWLRLHSGVLFDLDRRRAWLRVEVFLQPFVVSEIIVCWEGSVLQFDTYV